MGISESRKFNYKTSYVPGLHKAPCLHINVYIFFFTSSLIKKKCLTKVYIYMLPIYAYLLNIRFCLVKAYGLNLKANI